MKRTVNEASCSLATDGAWIRGRHADVSRACEARVVLDASCEDAMVPETLKRGPVRPNQIYGWKKLTPDKAAMDSSLASFSRGEIFLVGPRGGLGQSSHVAWLASRGDGEFPQRARFKRRRVCVVRGVREPHRRWKRGLLRAP